MSLSGEERGALHQALFRALGGDVNALIQMVDIKLDTPLGDVVTLPGPLNDVVFNLIKWAEKRDRKLIELLEGAPDYLPNPTLKIVAQRLLGQLRQAAPVAAGGNPFKTCFVRLDRVFVNRNLLREELERMVPAAGNRVLVVNGDPKSGKTYTLELIIYLSRELSSYSVAWLDLSREKPVGSDYTPDMLLRSLAKQMKIDPGGIPTQASTSGRWVRELRDWLIYRLDPVGPVWWIVLDGVSQVRLNDPIRDFIEELAFQAEMSPLDRLRIVLISYKESLNSILGRYREEKIGPINRADLIEFFRGVRGAHGLPPDPTADQQRAQALYEEVAALKRARRLPTLAERVEQEVKALLRSAGAAGSGPAAAAGTGAARAGAGGGQV